MVNQFERLKNSIWTRDKGFNEIIDDRFAEIAAYFAIILVIGWIITTIGVVVQDPQEAYFSAIGAGILFIMYAVSFGAALPACSYVLLRLLGGKMPFEDMVKLYMCASTPQLLLGWVPCGGTLASLVTAGNVVRGIVELNKISYWRGLIAGLVPMATFLILFVALVLMASA